MSFFIIIATQLGRIACIAGAVILAVNGIGGWGWFLVVAIYSGVTWEIGKQQETENE